MLALELHSSTLPAGKALSIDLTKSTNFKDQTFTIKEGIEYKYACISI